MTAEPKRQPMGSPRYGRSRTWEPYLRIPFLNGGRDSSGVDCWGLVYLIYKQEFGIELPLYGAISVNELLTIQRQIESDKTHNTWVLKGAGEETLGDIVIMTGTLRPSGGILRSALVHVGLVTQPGYLIHTEEGIGVQHVPFGSTGLQSIRTRVKEIYRYRG